jgi:crossover junction endodeoxyribonuclease RuvC
MRLAIGVDPGLQGAIALVTDSHDILCLLDTPTIAISKGRKRLDVQRHFEQWTEVRERVAGRPVLACVERMIPGRQKGSLATASLFYHYGVIEALLMALAIPSFSVEPARWKQRMILSGTRDEAQARLVASHLFPLADDLGKKHAGRADALLLAEYALRTGA